MRFSARATKTLPRTWFMSVTVLSLPESEANSAASFSVSRSCCSSRAWKMQRVAWPFLRGMRQERASENWRRHLLLESRESEFIWKPLERMDLPQRHGDTETERQRDRETERQRDREN